MWVNWLPERPENDVKPWDRPWPSCSSPLKNYRAVVSFERDLARLARRLARNSGDTGCRDRFVAPISLATASISWVGKAQPQLPVADCKTPAIAWRLFRPRELEIDPCDSRQFSRFGLADGDNTKRRFGVQGYEAGRASNLHEPGIVYLSSRRLSWLRPTSLRSDCRTLP